MSRSKLDKIDRKILANLQSDGRMTNVDLAKDVGISAPPCLRRVRSLEERGYIKGYHADINAASLGYSVTVYAMVTLSTQTEKKVVEFEDYIRKQPMVRECTMISGDVDFILKVVAKDWEDYQGFRSNVLTAAPSVASVKSSLVVRTSKDEPGIPFEG